jgi:FAD/FMN-containing dehydrogenase/Fe-S oxidoreductase
MDPQQRDRVHDDLKGIVKGELLFDDLSRVLYSTDASMFEVRPLGVVLPRDEDDVRALVKYAADNQVSLVPRGAGTGFAGESLGPGLIVDLSKHFRAILDIGSDTVRVQPGVTNRELAHRLAAVGRRFAPDPASGECTVGGMLATNASGSRLVKHGYTCDHVVTVRAVLDTAEAVTAGQMPRVLSVATGARISNTALPVLTSARLDDIVTSTVTLLERNTVLIQEHRPRTPFDRCGYRLHDVLDADSLNLARLLVGSEGTLALFTEATLGTIPLASGRAVVLLSFSSLDSALKAASKARATGPSACELIDRRLLRLARGGDAALAELVPEAAEAVLLVEYEADSPVGARNLAVDLSDRLHRFDRLAAMAHVAADDADAERCWHLREAAMSSLYGLRGGAMPLAFVEDVGVPPEELPVYLLRVQDLLQRNELTASFLIHAGTGQVHMRPFLDPRRREDAARMWTLAEDLYTIVLNLGGTISSQHGTGLARTPWVVQQYGPLDTVFRDLKAIFDPRRLFNPGKIVGPVPGMPFWPVRSSSDQETPDTRHESGDTRQVTRDTRPGEQARTSPSTPDTGSRVSCLMSRVSAEGEVMACNGCGSCRTEAPQRRMCPIFRASGDEAASPRAKANLLRYLFRPDTDARLLPSDEVRAVADLCVNCKMCASECPAHVDVPRLMLDLKAANVEQHGLSRTDWALARSEAFARLGSAVAPLTNALLGNRVVRWLLEKLLGVSRLRRMPSFAITSFLRLARRRGWTRRPRSNRPRVAYFVDVFANYNDPSVAEAVVSVLHHNGIEVYVPAGQTGCGMAPLAQGDLETARDTARTNLRVLTEAARAGLPILCSEPTAAVMLRQDAVALLDDPDARLVADRTIELTSYLWDLHQKGSLRTDFAPLDFSVGHHVPCHLKALGRQAAGPSLLRLVPGLRVRTIDVSCSGMAGTFGLGAATYSMSLAAGRPMLDEMSRPGVLFGSTECSTCRIQMEDGAGKRTLHPAQYLALAYGLMPELFDRLRRPLGNLVLQ